MDIVGSRTAGGIDDRTVAAELRAVSIRQDLKLGEEPATLDQLDKLDAELLANQRAAAQPKPHHFELSPK